jgi:hypothetical protein
MKPRRIPTPYRVLIFLTLVSLAAVWASVAKAGPAQAAPPDCTRADKHDGTGIHQVGDQAQITFTLDRDCVVSLWSYAERGPGEPPVDSDVASTAGDHTLSVLVCAQVDFVPGPTHEMGSGEAFAAAFFDTDCEVPPSTTTTAPTTSTTTSPPTPTTTTSVIPATSSTTFTAPTTSSTPTTAQPPSAKPVPDCSDISSSAPGPSADGTTGAAGSDTATECLAATGPGAIPWEVAAGILAVSIGFGCLLWGYLEPGKQ